jgi:hypothetical protein
VQLQRWQQFEDDTKRATVAVSLFRTHVVLNHTERNGAYHLFCARMLVSAVVGQEWRLDSARWGFS